MAQTLEAMRGGGGSVKVGTTGTIGALMSRELESVKPATQTPVFDIAVSPAESSSVPCETSTPRGLKSRDLMDEASSSGKSNGTKCTSLEIGRKTKHHSRKSRIPMLDSDNVSIDGTPIRQKSDKRITYMVEVVDIKCGSPDKPWASPITNRLKKLGFSKLSENSTV